MTNEEQKLVNSGKNIEKSNVFISLFSNDYKKDPFTAFQLGVAVMLDKPIALIVLKGAKVSEHIRKIAFAIEYVTDPDTELKEASHRIVKRAKELGIMKS